MRFWAATLRDLAQTARGCDAHVTVSRERPQAWRPNHSASRLRADIRDGWRGLWSSPGVTLSALVILTLGIGASTAIFSIVDAVVLRGLPFSDAGRLVSVAETDLPDGGRPMTVAPQNYADWLESQRVFETIGASSGGRRFTTVDLPAESLRSVNVTASLFDVLRVSPAFGRAFRASDEARRPGSRHPEPQPLAYAIPRASGCHWTTRDVRDRDGTRGPIALGDRRRDAGRVHLSDSGPDVPAASTSGFRSSRASRT